jgi:phosphonate transport system substrate-binding protein
VSEGKVDTKAVDVFHTTGTFFNYNWSMHADTPVELRNRVQRALLALDPAKEPGTEILKLNRATRYLTTTPDNYKGIEAAARAANLL